MAIAPIAPPERVARPMAPPPPLGPASPGPGGSLAPTRGGLGLDAPGLAAAATDHPMPTPPLPPPGARRGAEPAAEAIQAQMQHPVVVPLMQRRALHIGGVPAVDTEISGDVLGIVDRLKVLRMGPLAGLGTGLDRAFARSRQRAFRQVFAWRERLARRQALWRLLQALRRGARN